MGKTTLVQLFAQKHNKQLMTLNLERHADLRPLFAEFKVDRILQFLEDDTKQKITPNTLVFFDEIQALPEAVSCLRYFYEDRPELPLIAAGSLLDVILARFSHPMPVGRVEFLHIDPICFSDFVRAMGFDHLYKRVSQYQWGDTIDITSHKKLLDLFYLFYIVGGMPEAIKTYAQTQQMADVYRIHQSIVESFQGDLPKHITTPSVKHIFNVLKMSAQLIGKKVKYTNYLMPDVRPVKEAIEKLSLARLLRPVTHSHCNALPLQAEMKAKVYKLLFLDIGLVNYLQGLVVSQALAQPQKLVHSGSLAEQFVAQHLQAQLPSVHRDLTYWLRDGNKGAAEVDFVAALHNHIWPIEVKSGASGSLKSLHQFAFEKKSNKAFRLDTNLPSLQKIKTKVTTHNKTQPVEYNLYSLPLYLAEKLTSIAQTL